jgi:hypothetical protein
MKVTTLVLLAASLFAAPAVGWASNGPAGSVPEGSRATQLIEYAPASEKTPAPASESEEYAKREAVAQSLQEFKGGSGAIYIGGSAGVVLLVVLLIVLL